MISTRILPADVGFHLAQRDMLRRDDPIDEVADGHEVLDVHVQREQADPTEPPWEHAVGRAEPVGGQRGVLFQDLDVVSGLLARGVGVDVAADRLDLLGDGGGGAGFGALP